MPSFDFYWSNFFNFFGLHFFLGSDAVLYSEQQFSPPHVKVNAQLGLSFQTEFTIIRKLEQKISKIFPLVEFIWNIQSTMFFSQYVRSNISKFDQMDKVQKSACFRWKNTRAFKIRAIFFRWLQSLVIAWPGQGEHPL